MTKTEGIYGYVNKEINSFMNGRTDEPMNK